MGDKTTTPAGVFCLLFFGLPMPIIAVLIAIAESGNPCQTTDAIGLNLSQWLLGSGIVGLIIDIGFGISYIMVICYDSGALAIVVFALTIVVSLFNFVYSIIGAIILFRSNSKCLNQGTDLGIYSLIVLIFYWLSILLRLCKRPS